MGDACQCCTGKKEWSGGTQFSACLSLQYELPKEKSTTGTNWVQPADFSAGRELNKVATQVVRRIGLVHSPGWGCKDRSDEPREDVVYG